MKKISPSRVNVCTCGEKFPIRIRAFYNTVFHAGSNACMLDGSLRRYVYGESFQGSHKRSQLLQGVFYDVSQIFVRPVPETCERANL